MLSSERALAVRASRPNVSVPAPLLTAAMVGKNMSGREARMEQRGRNDTWVIIVNNNINLCIVRMPEI